MFFKYIKCNGDSAYPIDEYQLQHGNWIIMLTLMRGGDEHILNFLQNDLRTFRLRLRLHVERVINCVSLCYSHSIKLYYLVIKYFCFISYKVSKLLLYCTV